MYFVIYKRPDNTYYYKVVKYFTHYVGFVNQYKHEVILIISIPRAYYKRCHPLKYFLKNIIRHLVRVLDKIIKKLD